MERIELPGGKLGVFAGIAFAVLLFLTVAVVDAPRTATDQEVVTWWSDSGNQFNEVLSMFFALFAGLSFLVFITQLCARLRAAEGGQAPTTMLVFASGIVFTALLFVAGIARGAVSMSVRFGDEPLPGVDMLRFVPEVSFVVLGPFGLITAACGIAATSWLILRTGAYGRWLGWFGFVVAVALLLGSPIIGAFLLPVLLLWALAMSFGMWRAGRHASTSGMAVPAPGV